MELSIKKNKPVQDGPKSKGTWVWNGSKEKGIWICSHVVVVKLAKNTFKKKKSSLQVKEKEKEILKASYFMHKFNSTAAACSLFSLQLI